MNVGTVDCVFRCNDPCDLAINDMVFVYFELEERDSKYVICAELQTQCKAVDLLSVEISEQKIGNP
jgi:hypothetical protein